MFFTDILPKLRSEFIFRDQIAKLASNMMRLACGHWKDNAANFFLSEQFQGGTWNSKNLFLSDSMPDEEIASRSGKQISTSW